MKNQIEAVEILAEMMDEEMKNDIEAGEIVDEELAVEIPIAEMVEEFIEDNGVSDNEIIEGSGFAGIDFGAIAEEAEEEMIYDIVAKEIEEELAEEIKEIAEAEEIIDIV